MLTTALLGISFTFEELSKWYNGYNSGDGESLYNPWSIARALQGNKLRSYWVKSGKTSLLADFAFTFSKYLSVGCDQVVTTRIHHFLGSDDQFHEQIEKLIMAQGPIIVQIPNHEIRSLYHEWLRDHLKDYVNKSSSLTIECVDIFQNMVSGRMVSFAKGFSKLIWRTMPTQFLGCKEYVYLA